MMLAAVTNGTERRLCEITNLLDADGDETSEIDEAHSAVIKWDDHTWISFTPNEPMSAFVQQAT